MLFVIFLPSCYYSSLLQYSDRTVQNTTLTSFPFIAYYGASHKVATPISTLGTNFRPKRVENRFTKSKPGAPLPYFLRSKQPKKPVLVDFAFVMEKLAEKVVFPVFFYSLSFSLPLFFTQTCPNKFCAPTKSRSSFFPSVLFCGCLILSSRRSRLRKGVDYWCGCFRLGLPNFVRWASAVVTKNWV